MLKQINQVDVQRVVTHMSSTKLEDEMRDKLIMLALSDEAFSARCATYYGYDEIADLLRRHGAYIDF